MRLTIRRLTIALALLCAGLLPRSAQAQWSIGYLESATSTSPSSINWAAVTHISDFSVAPNSNGTLTCDFGGDTCTSGAFTTARANWISTAHSHGVKVLMCVSDGAGATGFSSATSSGTVGTLVSNIMAIVNANGYDGVDIDWEHSFSANSQATTFFADLRAALGSKILTAAAVVTNYSYWGANNSSLDRVNFMTYDLEESGNPYTWFNSALNSDSNEEEWSVALIKSRAEGAGMPAAKMGIGLPFYGYVTTGGATGPRQSLTGSVNQTTYRSLLSSYSSQMASPTLDSVSQTPWFGISGGWVEYDNAASIAAKINYVKTNGLGGWILFSLNKDGSGNPLAAAVAAAIGGGGGGAPVAPTINSFTAAPSSISSGSSSTLAWSISGTTTSVSISGIGPVTGTSASVSPLTSTTYTLTAQNGTASSSKNVTVTVTPSGTCNITTTSLPGAVQSAPYSQALNQSGCSGSWSVSSGSLPAGLSLSGAGVISGTPTGTGSSSFTVAVGTDTQALSLNVTAAAACSITSTSLPGATVGTSYSQTPSSSGCSGTWAISSGSLPGGLSLNSSTGAITGTPTAAGTFSFTIANGSTSRPLSILVNASCSIVTSALPGGVVRSAYSQTLSESGCSGSWSATGLPPGFSISGSTLSGTPSVAGSTSVTLSIGTASKTLVLAISPASGGYDGNIDISQMQTRVLSGGLNATQFATTDNSAKGIGGVLAWDSHHNAVGINPGTSGDVLTSNGPGVAPTYQATSGGGGGAGGIVAALSSFTWVNQGSATAAQGSSNGPILMTLPKVSSLNWAGLFLTPPSTPYKVIAELHCITQDFLDSQVCGVYFYDGTKLLGFEFLMQTGGTQPRIEHITNITTDGSTPQSGLQQIQAQPIAPIPAPLWVQLRDDGTNLYVDYSPDGVNFINWYSEAVGSYLTPTQIGFGGVNVTSSANLDLYVSLLNWQTYTNATL